MWPNGYGFYRKNYNDPTPNYPDSDESDSDEMLPLGAFWPTPEEEEWTIVGKPHGVQRYDKDIDCNRLHYTCDKLDRSGMCCEQLDYIEWNVTQYDSDKFLSERRKLAYLIPMTFICGRYRPDEMRRHRTIARRPQAGKDHNRTGSRASRS